jgi:EAL domain-containing protein (putative c-di-GMP-specific phosphodiesterase class I)/GGDEF domain-containing protein
VAQSMNKYSLSPLHHQAVRGAVIGALIALMPGLSLLSYWLGGETALVLSAVVLPCVSGLVLLAPKLIGAPALTLPRAEVPGQSAFNELARNHVEQARRDARSSAVFMIEIDDYDRLVEHHGKAAMERLARQAVQRVRSAVRSDDVVGWLRPPTFGLSVAPQNTLDLEICLEISGRLTRLLSEPHAIDGTSIYVTASIGFCQLGRETASEDETTADPVILCAEKALSSAQAAAPGAIRAYARTVQKQPAANLHAAALDAAEALENGEIVAWFQPQISTDTGRITGFEALARWIHPQRGPVSPAEFLPKLQDARMMNRLSEVMVCHALTAMRAWDAAGADIQQVGVNFSSDELSDPKLVDKLSWELDRFELGPDRLAVEILETVVAKGPDDVITRNINGLSELGCRIDLDDFGTGHASLASIRRFGVGRIKIDRSFVMKCDRDPEQQRMIRAILTMAEKLDLETIAEGVETAGEHSLLAQLGCTHVQGFGIGRPMPLDQTLHWIREHNAKVQAPPTIGRASG